MSKKTIPPEDMLDPIGEKFLDGLTDILYKYSIEQSQRVQNPTPGKGWTIYDTEDLLSELKVSLDRFISMVDAFEDVWVHYENVKE